MTVTITGGAAKLAVGGLGVTGVTGTVELVPVHPSGVRPSYGFTEDVLSAVDPIVIELSAGGNMPAAQVVLASSALRPDGCRHTVTWRLATSEGLEEVISYDVWIGPDGGECDLSDPANRVQDEAAPGLLGWPDTGPLVVYAAEGAP